MSGLHDDDHDDDDCYNFDDVATTVGSLRLMDDASSSLSSGTRAVTAASSFRRRGIGRPATAASSGRTGAIGSARSVASRGGGSIAAPRRPLTAKSRAGYSSSRPTSSVAGGDDRMDGWSVAGSIVADTTTVVVVDPGTEAREMEDDIHRLLEESTLLLHRGDLLDGLDKAKEAGKLERKLVKHWDVRSLSDDDVSGDTSADDLMFGTWFQLALAYEKNSLEEEAMKAYEYLSKQRGLASSWKAQVNLGNAQYRRGDYDDAVRSYQMALDRIPPGVGQQIGFRVCRNLSNALLHLGRHRDTTHTLEAAMSATVPECEAAFNLLLCHVAKGDADKAKLVFCKMLDLPSLLTDANIKGDDDGHDDDDLSLELMRRRKVASDLVVNAARLVASSEGADGLKWTINKVREAELDSISHVLEMERMVQHLRSREDIDGAIKMLKAFGRKDKDGRAAASTNLAFAHLLEGNVNEALDQASLAVTTNRYDARALTNLGCSYYLQRDFDKARDCIMEAVGVDAGCVEAMYNLGLVSAELRDYDGAVQAFERVIQLVPNHIESMYWLSRIGPSQYEVIYESLQL
mmetsp:Transcript_26959/g.77748  ORF Transcript_26959/g.77748 Transcript_26959/m.77748 type:complete len:575 (-) Transcript_26959:63-1787(-)